MKIEMKNILQSISIVFALIASFLGLLYILKGDILISGLVSSVIVVILYFLIQQFMKNKTEITKQKFSILSIILWSAYIALGIPISLLLVHCLNVEINAKKDIKSLANSKISSLNSMIIAYNSQVDNYLTVLGLDLKTNAGKYFSDPSNTSAANFLMNNGNIPEQDLQNYNSFNIVNKINYIIKAKKILFSNVVDTISNENSNFVNTYSSVFDNWGRLKLNFAFYKLDKMLTSNYAKLKRTFANQTIPTKPFVCPPYSKEQGLMNTPLELWQLYRPYYLILVVILFNVLLLLPYFLEPASGAYLTQKGYEEVLEGGIEIK